MYLHMRIRIHITYTYACAYTCYEATSHVHVFMTEMYAMCIGRTVRATTQARIQELKLSYHEPEAILSAKD